MFFFLLLLQIALELSKEFNRNYGDEITFQIRLARKKRWNALEEKRISEEIELQNYLNKLIKNDQENQLQKLWQDVENKIIDDEQTVKKLEKMINKTYDERVLATNDLFAQVDAKRKVKDFFLFCCEIKKKFFIIK